MKILKLNILFFFCILLISNANSSNYELYENKYIVIENIDNNFIRIGNIDIKASEYNSEKLKSISEKFKSKMFLVGLKTDFTVGALLQMGMKISAFEGKVYTYSKKTKSIKELTFSMK